MGQLRSMRARKEYGEATGTMEKGKALELEANLLMDKVRVKKAKEARAEFVAKALSDEEVRKALRFTDDHVELLKGLAKRPGRNAGAQLGALKLMAEVAGHLEREKGGVESVVVTVNTLGGYRPDPEVTSASVGGILPERSEPTKE